MKDMGRIGEIVWARQYKKKVVFLEKSVYVCPGAIIVGAVGEIKGEGKVWPLMRKEAGSRRPLCSSCV